MITFRIDMRKAPVVVQLFDLAWFGGVVTFFGIVASLPAALFAWLACATLGINDWTRPVQAVVIGFVTGALGPFLLLASLTVLWSHSGAGYLPAELIGGFYITGYFGARGEWLAYTVRRSTPPERTPESPATSSHETADLPTVDGA